MKSKLISKISLLFLGGVFFLSAYSSQNVIPSTSFTATSGANVVVYESHTLPIVDLRIIFDAGFERDGNLLGLANITQLMLKEPTRGSLGFEQTFGLLGTLYSVEVNANMTVISLRCLSEEKLLHQSIGSLIDLLGKPNFKRTTLMKVKQMVAKDLDAIDQDPDRLVYKIFNELLYKNLPYGHLALGDRLSLRSISVQDVQNFYTTYYTAPNATIVLGGDVTLTQARNIAEQITKSLKPRKRTVVTKPHYDYKKMLPKSTRQQIDLPLGNTTILVGGAAIGINSPNIYALLLANYILSDAFNVSLLYQKLRTEKNLAYQINSSLDLLRDDIGSFSVYTVVKNKDIPKTLAAIYQTLKEFLPHDFTQEDFIRYRESFANSYLQELDSNKDKLDMLGRVFFYKLSPEHYNQFREKILSLTREQVVRAFHQSIDLDNLITVTVGSRNS